MLIREVRIGCSDPEAADEFYGGLLGLSTARANESVRVTAGWTKLTLTRAEVIPGAQHLAFTIPRNRFAEAKDWLTDRLTLLRTDEADEFECAPHWNARSLYFEDPDRNILEFIIRRELPNESTGTFSGADILGVSEVGVPVFDVSAFQDATRTTLDLEAYGQGGPTFRPIGDVGGLLIAVERGRSWFPTDRRAEVQPLEVTIESGVRAELRANDSCVIRAR